MSNILEMSKNIHPTHTLSSEELKDRYIEIYPEIKRDIEFFIETYPQTSTPLFISGQIGSGKSTLLKSFLFEDQTIHYFDISDLFIENPKNSMEVCLVIFNKIIELIYPESDLSPIDHLIERNKSDDMFNSFTSDDIIDIIEIYEKNNKANCKAIIIDGLDRLLELSDHNTIKEILFDYAYIWKLLEEKLIFVTPLLFTQYNSALDAYNKVYEPDSLSNTHITIPVPDPTNLVFWKQFISIRAKMDDLKLNAQKINKLVEISGGLLRGTLVVLRHLLNLMYRDGDIVVKEKHIIKLQEDVKVSLRNLQSSLSPQEFEKIAFIDKHKPSQIPNGALSLFARDIPLVLFTQREEKTMCVIHPLIDLNEIPF